MGKTQSLCHNSPIWKKRAAITKKPGQEICKQDQIISAFGASRIFIKEREWVKLSPGNKVFFQMLEKREAHSQG